MAGTPLDDDVIAASMLGHSVRSWDDVRAAPYGILEDRLAPGWLVPQRLPHLLDIAPADLVNDLDGLDLGSSTYSSDTLVLVNRRTSTRYNSFDLLGVVEPLLIHPDDAEARGLRDGDLACVATTSGTCRATVKVTDRMRPGVVSLPHGSETSDVNRLTSARKVDARNGMPVLSGFAVTVSAASA
jgi:hypothetical protein